MKEAIINKGKIGPRRASKISSSLLALPRELRNEIYRNLLLTSRTFSVNNSPQSISILYFKLQTAILSVNQQISEEATSIWYEENDCVCVYLDFVAARRHRWAFCSNLQRFRGIPDRAIQPVLGIWIEFLDAANEEPQLYDQDLCCLTTAEGLSSFCESVYLIDTPYPWLVPLEAPVEQLSLTIELFDKTPMKQSELLRLQKSVLEPFRLLHGFREFFFLGIVDTELNELLQGIWRHVKRGPTENTAKRFLEICDKLSKEQYALGRYRAVRVYCTSLMRYRNFLRILLETGYHDFDRALPGLIRLTWTKAMEAGLTNVKSVFDWGTSLMRKGSLRKTADGGKMVGAEKVRSRP